MKQLIGNFFFPVFCAVLFFLSIVVAVKSIILEEKTGIVFTETNLEQLKVIKDYDHGNIVYLYQSKVDGLEIAVGTLEVEYK